MSDDKWALHKHDYRGGKILQRKADLTSEQVARDRRSADRKGVKEHASLMEIDDLRNFMTRRCSKVSHYKMVKAKWQVQLVVQQAGPLPVAHRGQSSSSDEVVRWLTHGGWMRCHPRWCLVDPTSQSETAMWQGVKPKSEAKMGEKLKLNV